MAAKKRIGCNLSTIWKLLLLMTLTFQTGRKNMNAKLSMVHLTAIVKRLFAVEYYLAHRNRACCQVVILRCVERFLNCLLYCYFRNSRYNYASIFHRVKMLLIIVLLGDVIKCDAVYYCYIYCLFLFVCFLAVLTPFDHTIIIILWY